MITTSVIILPPELDDHYLVNDCGHFNVRLRVRPWGKVSNLAIVLLDCRLTNLRVNRKSVVSGNGSYFFRRRSSIFLPCQKPTLLASKNLIFCQLKTSKMEIMENLQRQLLSIKSGVLTRMVLYRPLCSCIDVSSISNCYYLYKTNST